MNDIDNILDSAFLDYNQGNYKAAEQKAREVLIICPSHGDCFYLLGLIAHKKGIFAQACDLLNLAVKNYPDQMSYRLALAEVYQHHGDYDKALDMYRPFVHMPNVQLQLGWIALAQHQNQKAKKIFENLLSGELRAQAYRGLAFCYKDRKKWYYLQKSFNIDRNSFVVQDIVAYLLQRKNYKKISSYMPYLKNDLLKSKYLIGIKDYNGAKNILATLVLKNPYDVDVLTLMGVCSENLKDYPMSEKFYTQVLELDKNNWNAHKALARIMMRQKKLPIALEHYQVLCRLNPQDKETLLAMATILEGVEDEAEALGVYFRLLTLKCKGLNYKIKNCIERLYKKDAKLAKQFAKGWVKCYPQNKIAQKLLKILGLFLISMGMIFPVQADYFSQDKNWDLVWRNRMAGMGHAESQYELAQMFELGKDVPQDIGQAIHYYQLSAAQDYFPAMLKLGEIFRQENAYQDKKKSLQWYTYAAQKGEVQAQLYLANFYQEKEQFDKNQAKYWLEKALKQLFPNTTDLTQVSPDYKKLSE